MIPKNIKREHIIKAIEEIKRYGVQKGRTSKKFLLEFNGEYYPPKYVVSLANKYANGEELNPSEFSGGEETNNFLRALGFNIIDASTLKKTIKPSKNKRETKLSSIHHNERCLKCKETIRKLLEKIYGKVEENYKFNVGTHPEDFKDTPHYNKLKEIYEALQNYRGFKEFIKAKTLPNCDFFVPNPGINVEFDESQHFTILRKITLERYTSELELGLSREKWIKLCEEINAKDNDPPYRDEQRAWYDTLRDFLPVILGFKPTARLFAKDFVWCSLNPDNPKDVSKFRKMIEKRIDREIEVKEDPEPFLARIIIAGEWEGNPEEVRRLLEDIHDKWPKDKRVKFLITCGGFIQFDWPKSISKENINDNKNPNSTVVSTLVAEAEKSKRFILSDGLGDKLKEVTDYMTLGIDSYKGKISMTQNYISQPHIELVFLIDLRNNKFYWTGKSYPTPNQQNGLVRIVDLNTHFLDLDVGKVMILGCHDLTIFNPRSKNAKGWRRKVNEEFKNLASKQKPICVLQHPHTTVKVRTWLNAWSCLKKLLPFVEIYASAGRYHEPGRCPLEGDRIDAVLRYTKCGDTIDFIVHNSGGGNK